LTNYAISLGHIKEILANENVTIKEGDILLIRTGLSKWIRASTPQSVGPWEDNTYIGVDPTPEFLEWVWNNHIAALGSDATSVEAIPASDGTSRLQPLTAPYRTSMSLRYGKGKVIPKWIETNLKPR
jgi:kynurenine formamidase